VRIIEKRSVGRVAVQAQAKIQAGDARTPDFRYAAASVIQ
jgi:hypothetical protein